MLRICLAGATGNVGRLIARAILDAPDLTLTGAIARRQAGAPLGPLLGDPRADALILQATVGEALAAGADVLIDYTHPDVVAQHVYAALDAGVHVVVGASGLSDADYEKIDRRARAAQRGVVAAGNFSITAALLQHLARVAAPFVPTWEIIDYAPDTKPDAPSGTARELAFSLGQAGTPRHAVSVEETKGEPGARGVVLAGTPVHSVRVPGYYSSVEVHFGLPGERLVLRHDSMSYAPYVAGTLLAARAVPGIVGLRRGVGTLLGLPA